jgi:hypothetical protein
VRLHSRDLEVLDLIADRRVETLGALHKKLWPDCTRKSAYNRLGQLAAAGYLDHHLRPDPIARASVDRRPSQHIYILGPKAPAAMRLRNRDTRKLVAHQLPGSFIDHQLATNRVGDWLGIRLIGEIEASAGLDSRHRPDAAYHASRDHTGRDLMLLEVDLGHYSRQRITAKVEGFRKHPHARGIVFACPTDDRAWQVKEWISDRFGSGFMRRCQVFSFDDIQRGAHFDRGTQPVAVQRRSYDWYTHIFGDAGSR